MRAAISVIALSIVPYVLTGTTTPAPSRVDFDSDVKPILQAKCTPCHFSGGQMYDRLPFDRSETVRKLGEKLFTRIRDEKHRRVIKEFLAQQP